MENKLRNMLPQICERLEQKDIKYFKVGKTSSPEERFNAADYNNYHLASVIAYSDNVDIINVNEKELIDYFTSHKTLKHKCVNEQSGGGQDATSLYVIASYEDADHLLGLLDKTNLLDIDYIPIKL